MNKDVRALPVAKTPEKKRKSPVILELGRSWNMTPDPVILSFIEELRNSSIKR